MSVASESSKQENMSEMDQLALRALSHYRNKTTDMAQDQMTIPVSAYRNTDRFTRESEQIFKRLPLAFALSLELPEQGSYLARKFMDIPVLITRDKNGEVHGFLNVCRHRGAILCPEGRGDRGRFSCPYHSWTYSNQGELIGVYGADAFGDIERADFSLTKLPCEEKYGIIWLSLSPETGFDIDDWLGEFAPRLDSLKLDQWFIHEIRDLPGPGWKAAMDGYLEVYHHDTVHGQTVGQHTIGNLLVHDLYGPHQRLTFARRNIDELDARERSGELAEGAAIDGAQYIRLIHSIFPNLSISGILGEHCLVSQLQPCGDHARTLTRQYLLTMEEPKTAEQKKQAELFSAMTLQAVRDEDYAIVQTIQDGLKSDANTHFVFGRNEPGLQHYHRMVAQFGGEKND